MSSKLVKFWTSGRSHQPVFINPQMVAVVGCVDPDKKAPARITLNTGGEVDVCGDVEIIANMIAIALLGGDPNETPEKA